MAMYCCTSPLAVATHLCASSQILYPLRTIGTCSVQQYFNRRWYYNDTFSPTKFHHPRLIGMKNDKTIVKGSYYANRKFSTTPVHHIFWEPDEKGGYLSKKKHSKKELIRMGLKELRGELVKWQEEVKEKFETDPIIVRPGDMDKVWVFNKESDLEQWVVTSDGDHGEGFSSGALTQSPTGHGLFSGDLSTRVPKDGKVKKSGYVNMKALRARKSFKREEYLEWTQYNTLEIRLRGDGRSYLINISTAGYFDITWNDVYSYVLYTRGGPHWQVSKIPFSKFFMGSKGRVQDNQSSIPLDRVVSVGISAGDRNNAPFRLEVDYIGVYSDPDHHEEFAYEMYRLPKFFIT